MGKRASLCTYYVVSVRGYVGTPVSEGPSKTLAYIVNSVANYATAELAGRGSGRVCEWKKRGLSVIRTPRFDGVPFLESWQQRVPFFHTT